MNSKTLVSITLASLIFLASSVFAQSDPRYVQFPGLPPSVKGALLHARRFPSQQPMLAFSSCTAQLTTWARSPAPNCRRGDFLFCA